MTLPVVFRVGAFDEVTAIEATYETVRHGLGSRFSNRLKARLQLIAAQPKLFAILYRDVRATKVPKFPYIIYYRANTDRIEVVAVLHASRDASAWKSRV
jgi:toxin ParE1/3/4